ncbi:site-specific integrase [Desulfuromonas acetoxidans]|uniref:Phage integrase n=1 Tax=Desulfuromonas acetoxidans (strain DSM 684 / 11070) TaxID=281689 RepID=Q1K2Z6_DESA6|nr:site-specific integrase [Desulfuromonas acetoxidans]EAT16735.1 phage integrase [Desulfuromonas acetoxidans DSM 684]NVD23675.1 site-specific integrase [Desulfuromonas acetoxidans]NVE15940.1 site-specific integrase [Desulfuromonas acetoxidans]
MATFNQRKSGRWQAKIRRNNQAISKTFSRRSDAEAWARKTEAEIERGLFVQDLDAAQRITIREAADALTLEYLLPRLSDGHREKNRLEALLERSGWENKTLAQLRSKDIYDYMRNREQAGASANTIRLDLALLSRLYKHSIQKYGLEGLANPVKAVDRPSTASSARTRRLEEGEEETLLKSAHDDFKPAIAFALETAMRREEIATLTWQNINLEKRTAHLPKTKNGSARTVPLSTAAIGILKALPRQLDGQVFALTKKRITDRMRTTVKRAGLKDLRFHDLRHEATSRFFERGTLDMMEISRITGHKTLSMLSRYTHLRAADLAKKLG